MAERTGLLSRRYQNEWTQGKWSDLYRIKDGKENRDWRKVKALAGSLGCPARDIVFDREAGLYIHAIGCYFSDSRIKRYLVVDDMDDYTPDGLVLAFYTDGFKIYLAA